MTNQNKLITLDNLPTKIDFRCNNPSKGEKILSPVCHQGQLGSCSANALYYAIRYYRHDFIPSRLFIYYNERMIEKNVKKDAGVRTLADGIKSLKKYGVCSEFKCPYNISNFSIKPSQWAYDEGLHNKIIISDPNDDPEIPLDKNNINKIKQCLASGYICVLTFYVYDRYHIMQSPWIVDCPESYKNIASNDERHCVTMVGYDDNMKYNTNNFTTNKGCFIIQNSWGENSGDHGFFYMTYNFFMGTHLGQHLVQEIYCIKSF